MLLSRQHVEEMRSSCFEMNGSELDSIILGQLSAFDSVCSSVGISSRHSSKEREDIDFCIIIRGKKIVTTCSFFSHTIGAKRRNLITHFIESGIQSLRLETAPF